MLRPRAASPVSYQVKGGGGTVSTLTVQRSLANAVAQTLDTVLSDLALTPYDFGAVPNDRSAAVAAQNVVAFNALFLACANTKLSARIPDGEWNVKPQGTATYIHVWDNLHVFADSPAGVIRVCDDCGNYEKVFGDGGLSTSHNTFRGITFDQNPTGNTTADIRTFDGVTILDNSHCQFLFYYTGPGSNDIRWVGCRFDKVCGVNTLDVNASGAQNVVVFDCDFWFKRGHTTGTMPAWPGPFNGASGYDASLLYMACRGALVDQCRVHVDDYADFNGGFECHGVEQSYTNNRFFGCYTAFAVVPPFLAQDNQDPSNVLLEGNQINRAAVAIVLQLPSSSVGAKKWTLRNNPITLYQGTGHHDATESGGIVLRDNGSGGGVLDGLEITGHDIEFEPDTRSSSSRYSHALALMHHGIAISQRSATRNGTLRGNRVTRAPAVGYAIGFYAADAELTNLVATENESIDCGFNPNNATVNTNNKRAHWDVTGKVYGVEIYDNTLRDTGAISINGFYGFSAGPHVGAGTPQFSFIGENRHVTAVNALNFTVYDFGYHLFIRDFGAITSGAILSHENCPKLRVSPSSDVTGVILNPATQPAQEVTIFNESTHTITFAATGTFGGIGASYVAGGTSEVIPALSCRTYKWNVVKLWWFRVA